MDLVEILSKNHIMPQFPPGAMVAAEAVPKTVEESELEGRKDLRDKLLITIDGEDAKDFDDAVSLEILENGNFLLGVHIADVTHYVKENSPIDRAAFLRGTSVYLIDTVIPMLPFELSNELCSLKPDETRLAVSVFMEISKGGKVKNYEIVESAICSRNRMTYADVTKILDGDENLRKRFAHLVPMLENMKELAAVLNRKRVAEGSIEFETHESKITLDIKGKPVKIERYPITLSNNIIEEFMLIANVTVAKHLNKRGLPCVYRVHERPDMMRLERLEEVFSVLGIDFPLKTDMNSKDFQAVLSEAKGTEHSEVASYLMLRAMAKAKYSENNLGHFGLGFGTYCHFTSPIRRYADVAVHRILKESLKGEISEKRRKHLGEMTMASALTASVTEVNAAEAEFQWKAVKMAEFMAEKIGEEYEGVITHTAFSGFYVELPNTVEGFVSAKSIPGDSYLLSENKISLVGVSTKRTFTVGDKVDIRITSVDTEKSYIDFELARLPKMPKRPYRPIKSNKERKKDRWIVRDAVKEKREENLARSEQRKRIETEKRILENAVVAELFDLILPKKRFTRDEKGYLGITLSDLASNVSIPVEKAAIYEETVDMKKVLVSAALNVKNIFGVISDSFNLKFEEKTVEFASKFVANALKHFEKVLHYDNFSYRKRENEYVSIGDKLRKAGER